jgi:hypothetical protein
MLWMIAVILVVLWLFGVVTRDTTGGLVHLPLLIVAMIIASVSVRQSRRFP